MSGKSVIMTERSEENKYIFLRKQAPFNNLIKK